MVRRGHYSKTNARIKQQTVLIVEEDEFAARLMGKLVRDSFPIQAIFASNTPTAKKLLKTNISIKYLISSYDMTERNLNRVAVLANFCRIARPDIRQMGIGAFKKKELMFGKEKVFLNSADEFIQMMFSLVHSHVTFLENQKKDAEVIILSELFEYPYDV